MESNTQSGFFWLISLHFSSFGGIEGSRRLFPASGSDKHVSTTVVQEIDRAIAQKLHGKQWNHVHGGTDWTKTWMFSTCFYLIQMFRFDVTLIIASN